MVCCIGSGLSTQEALSNDHLSLQILWCLHKAFLRMHLLLSNTWLQVCTLKQCPTVGVVFLRQLSKVALLPTPPVILGAQRGLQSTCSNLESLYLKTHKEVLIGHNH